MDLIEIYAGTLVEETELVLRATAASEEFQRQMELVHDVVGLRPDEIKVLERKVLRLADQ